MIKIRSSKYLTTRDGLTSLYVIWEINEALLDITKDIYTSAIHHSADSLILHSFLIFTGIQTLASWNQNLCLDPKSWDVSLDNVFCWMWPLLEYISCSTHDLYKHVNFHNCLQHLNVNTKISVGGENHLHVSIGQYKALNNRAVVNKYTRMNKIHQVVEMVWPKFWDSCRRRRHAFSKKQTS